MNILHIPETPEGYESGAEYRQPVEGDRVLHDDDKWVLVTATCAKIKRKSICIRRKIREAREVISQLAYDYVFKYRGAIYQKKADGIYIIGNKGKVAITAFTGTEELVEVWT